MTTASGHTQAIRASKVIGTEVKDAKGDKIGKVEDVVLDKLSNDIMFAVIGFGGVLGMGEKYHPIPWAMLDYDPGRKAYRCDVSKEQLERAPSDTIDELTRDDGLAFRNKTYSYYGVTPYWS